MISRTLIYRFVFTVIASLPLAAVTRIGYGQESPLPGDLKQGRWAGTFRPAHTDLSLGVTFDVFLAQPNDIRDFPRLEAIFKMALGGINGSERDVTHYEKIHYDYITGNLTFDETNSDLVVRARVVGKNKITGDVTSSATGISGKLELFNVDAVASSEPCDPDEPCEPAANPLDQLPKTGYLPAFAGIYDGHCDGNPARLEIITARGLPQESAASDLLKKFLIQARLGTTSSTCGGDSNKDYCVTRSWNSAQFDFYQSRLALLSDQFTDDCKYGRKGNLVCNISFGTEKKACFLEPTLRQELDFQPSKPKYKLTPSTDERSPTPEGIGSLDPLRQTLDGSFAGYLFHERNGMYEPAQLEVGASISTDNPHNEPNVYVSGLFKLGLSDRLGPPFAGFKIDRRTFFPAKGLTLRSETSDLMLLVENWQKGYMSGTAYSKSFGRIGPFELIKGTQALNIPPNFKHQPALVGVFDGQKQSEANRLSWQFDIRLASGSGSEEGDIKVGGSAQVIAPGLPFPRFGITAGTYSLFDGSIAFLVRESESAERLVTGRFDDGNALDLWISSSSSWGARMSNGKTIRHARKN